MITPQLAKSTKVTSLESFIGDDMWIMEQKLDGHRLLLLSGGPDAPPTAITRNGTIYSRSLPKALQDFRFPVMTNMPNSPGAWVLDGELVGDTYWAFDLPHSPLQDLQPDTPLPLLARRAMLETFFEQMPSPGIKVVPQATHRDEKIALAEKALAENFEGLMLKRVDAPYRSGGRTDEWLKLKFVSTVDAVVTAVRDDGKDSVQLGLVESGKLVDVGRASLIGKEKARPIVVGDVVEVRYLYTGAGGRLYQPTILRVRDDKSPIECTTSQLKHVNKAVLEKL